MMCKQCSKTIPLTQTYWVIETGTRRGEMYCSRECVYQADKDLLVGSDKNGR